MIDWAFPEAIRGLSRAPGRTVVSIATIALALSIFGLFLYVSENLRGGIDRFRGASKVVAFLEKDDAATVRRLETDLRALPGVGEAQYYSRDEALARFRRDWGALAEEIVAAVDENPLPAFFEIRLAPGTNDAAALARSVHELAGIEEVEFGQTTAVRLLHLSRAAEAVTIVLGIFLSAFIFLIVLGAIRLALDARADEISVLRIVGASEGLIRLPFILEGIIKGFLGGVVSIVLLSLLHSLLRWKIPEGLIPLSSLTLTGDLVLLLLGSGLGALGSLVAVRSVLSEPERIGA